MRGKIHIKWIIFFVVLLFITAGTAAWIVTAASGSSSLIGGYKVEASNKFVLKIKNRKASSSSVGIKYSTNSWWMFKEETGAQWDDTIDYSYYSQNGLNITANRDGTEPNNPAAGQVFYTKYKTDPEQIVNKVLEWNTVGGTPDRKKLTEDGATVYLCRALNKVVNGTTTETHYNYYSMVDCANWSQETIDNAFWESYDIAMTLKFYYTTFTIDVVGINADGTKVDLSTDYGQYFTTKNEADILLYGERISFNYPGSLASNGYKYTGYKWTSGSSVIAEGTGTSTGSFLVDYDKISNDDLVLTFYYEADVVEEGDEPTPEPDPEITLTPTPTPSPTPTPIPYYTLSVNVSSYGGGTFDVAGAASNRTSYSSSYLEGSRVSLSAHADSDYIFDHWYVSGSTYTNSSITVTMNGRRSATAYFRPEIITVTLDPNGGVCDTATTTTEYGLTYGPLPVPTRVGYDFAGWYTKKTGGSLVEETTTVTEKYNHTIYAHWTPRDDTKYVVNHWKEDVDGNGYTLADTDNLQGTSDTQVVPDVKTYNGFTSPSTQSINVNADGSAVLDYYYTRNSYDLTLFTGKGIDSVSGAGTYKYEETVTLDATPATGYKWLQWTGDSFTENQKNYSFSMPYNNLWRMALAEPITYEVKYNPSGANAGTMANSTHVYDEGKTLTFNAYSLTYKVSYDLNLSTVVGTPFSNFGTEHTDAKADFLGWADTADGSVKYTNGKNVKNLSSVDGDIVNLYAVWQNGSVVLPNAVLSGYTLTGWKKDNTGTLYAVDDKYTPAADEKLYAQWEANSYTVTFDANGGSCSQASKSVTFNSTYGTLPTPTRYGYVFNGWHTTDTYDKVESTTTVTDAKNHTLIADWSPKTEIKVTFDWNFDYKKSAVDGETNYSADEMKVTYGTTYGPLPEPTREGYVFAGWYTSETSAGNGTGTRITSGTYVSTASAHTIHACWVPIESILEFDYNYDYTVWPNGN